MTIVFKDKTALVNDVITRLKPLLPENADLTSGSALRNIIESNMEELDIQYWQLEQVYDSGFIDYTSGNNLDKLVILLGIIRNAAIKSTGTVIFYRSTDAPTNYFIPSGTLIQTLATSNGQIQFETITDATLLSGTTSISVNVKAVIAGLSGNVPISTIKTINNPPTGIESVRNDSPMSGGEEIESDKDLTLRTKHFLDTSGLGTIDALTYKIQNISGVKEVSVQDMIRGIGTVDILVLTDTIPMISAKRDEINTAITATKAGGIDFLLTEPIVEVIPVNIVLTMIPPTLASSAVLDVTNALNNYMGSLNIGDDVILNQLRKIILNSNANILDIAISTPTNNIVISGTHIARPGVITIS